MKSASSSIDDILTSMGDPGEPGVYVKGLQTKKSDTLTILHQENVWVCDTGVST